MFNPKVECTAPLND